MSIPFHICGIEDREEFLEAARRHSAWMGRLTAAALIVAVAGAIAIGLVVVLGYVAIR